MTFILSLNNKNRFANLYWHGTCIWIEVAAFPKQSVEKYINNFQWGMFRDAAGYQAPGSITSSRERKMSFQSKWSLLTKRISLLAPGSSSFQACTDFASSQRLDSYLSQGYKRNGKYSLVQVLNSSSRIHFLSQ